MARRLNRTITIAAGTPINAVTGTTTGPAAGSQPVWASRYFVQMLIGGTGYGLVYDGVPISRPPVAGDLTAQLATPSDSAPGGSYEDWDKSLDRGGIDMNEVWIDGSHTGDTVAVSFVPKV